MKYYEYDPSMMS